VKPNSARASLAENRKLLGCWLQLFSPVVGEMMGLCGYDLVLIDMEHGLGTIADAANVMRAVRGTGASSFVRVPTNDPTIIKTLMDQGVDGIMVPMVETPEAARAAVQACRYPPKGVRGLAIGIARGANYGIDDIHTYVETIDDHTVVICQIETVAAVERAREIVEVDGVDMLFIGRNDLAADSGHILDLDHPEVNAMTDAVVAIAHAAGKKVGTVPSAGRSWQQLITDGFDLVIPSSDISILRAFGQEEVNAFKVATGAGSRMGTVPKGY
jgi:4-hydroxy-2-oxoheptanedioate aldolase